MEKQKKSKIKSIVNYRPPVVAVLGHVDHGKTTLLDIIRKSNVAKREHGGITQHIGAYQVEVNTKEGRKKITFIDTPGHETFSKIRSRGAKVADLAVLVIAVNDGVQPQTEESIKLIKEAGIPYIVALTKIDLVEKYDSVKRELKKFGVVTEENGGEVVCVGVSAKNNVGVNELLEMIILLAEMKGITSNLKALPEAVVIEAKIDKRRGVEASVIVKKGELAVGQEIFTQTQKGKIKALINDQGINITKADPSTPCVILGFTKPPLVGEITSNMEPKAEAVAEEEKNIINTESTNLFRIILKADTQNSLEALLMCIPQEGMEIISKGLGDITESDVQFAKTTKSFIIGFNVEVSSQAKEIARFEKVRIKTYQIIYELLKEINDVITSLGAIDTEEILGQGKIIAEFPFNNKRIAGVKVIEGRIAKGDRVFIKRNDEEIGQSHIKSVRKFKEEVNRIEVGEEGGLFLEPEVDFILDDMIVSVQS